MFAWLCRAYPKFTAQITFFWRQKKDNNGFLPASHPGVYSEGKDPAIPHF